MPLAAFLSIVELTNYSRTKHRKAFYRSAFSFVARLHNVGLLLLPISEQYYPVSNRKALSEIGPHIYDENWSRFTDGSRINSTRSFLDKLFYFNHLYASLYTEKYELLKL